MIDALSANEVAYLAQKGGIPPASLSTADHTMLVLAIANDPSHLAYAIMEKLIDKPIYMCARGETSQTILDDNNRPIITPRGSYRGLPQLANSMELKQFQHHLREYKAKVDNRVITGIMPNPKKKGSTAHEHYEQYTLGKSVTWHFNNTHITRADFRYDEKRGFVTVAAPGEVQTTA